MDIITCYENDKNKDFQSLKRRTKGAWAHLVSGEWSETPYHQGNISFSIRCSEDKRHWSLLRDGFPNKILAVATTEESCALEVAGGEMMRALKEGGHERIEGVHYFGDIDDDLLWQTYRQK